MRAARYSRRQMRSGPLVLVNRQHPLAEEPRQLLTAADERYPNILLERQAARLLAACIQAAGGAREIDFIRPDFPEEGACGRFRRLAPRYGFIQRYHREKESLTGIACEPWHYRYVGTPHALLMEREGLCLEEYLDWVQTAPRTCRLEHGRSARVFYMPCAGDETELRLPEGCCQVSGDNRNGFVVTVWEV